MSWQQLSFQVADEFVNDLSERLTDLGALSVTWQDAHDTPIFEPDPDTTPLWQNVIVIALFSEDTNTQAIEKNIQAAHFQSQFIKHEQFEDENWVEKNLENFTPIALANSVWICPSWHEVDAPGATIVTLNPGLAFGTGEHATTLMCLNHLAQHPPKAQRVLDFGCGSGILAVTACMLGAQHVSAVDIDEQALLATKQNAALNAIDASQLFIAQPEQLNTTPVDCLIANIFLTPLLTLSAQFAKLVKPTGYLLLSGVLNTQYGTLAQVYAKDFTLDIIDEKDQWLLIKAQLKNF